MVDLITEHIATWTGAHIPQTNGGRGRGRGTNGQSPHGIKKLRELILELAVRGKLVPQDPNDEPASVLLEEIAKEKARLIKEGKIKKTKPLPKISEDEMPFKVPKGWEWVPFGNIAQHNAGKTLDSRKNTGKPRDYLTTSNLYWGRFDLTDVRQMLIREDELEKCTVRAGDLLICEGGEAGRAAVWEKDYEICFQNHVHRARFYGGINPHYAYRFFEQLNATGRIEEYRKGVGISNMSGKSLASIFFPLPPIGMQQKVVSKVDELMTLCDKLEQQQTDSNETHQTLVETLLATLTTVADPAEFAISWQRIVGHFDTLFTTAQSIDQLKQTILQLAVMGKLVPQDPSNEPASTLLEKIAKEKALLVKEGKIKRQKPLPELNEEEKLFDLPEGWAWSRFGDAAQDISTGPFGSMLHKSDYTNSGIPLVNPSHMIDSEIVEELNVSVSEKKAEELKSYRLQSGDIVMARRGEMGRCALVGDREEGWLCGTGSFILRFYADLYRRYILLLFKTNYVRQYLGGASVGATMTNLNHGILNKMPILLPPTDEQHRIVAKVDELMALCDTIKERLHDAKTTQVQLADAIVEQAVA